MDVNCIAQMEHVLDIYAEEADADNQVVTFKEAMKPEVSEVTLLKPVKLGHMAKQDYEHKREAVANELMMFDRHLGWRCAKVTPTKKSMNFAQGKRI